MKQPDVTLAAAVLAAGTFDPEKERPKRSLFWFVFRCLQWLATQCFLLMGSELRDTRMPQCEVRVRGERVVDRIVRACKGSERLAGAPIAVAANPEDGAPIPDADATVRGGDTLGGSLRRAVEALPPTDRVLVICGDLPLLDPQALDKFIEDALTTDAQLCIGYVEYGLIQRQYPGLQKTAARLFDGTVYQPLCAAGVVLLDPREVERIAAVLDVFAGARKNVLAVASLLGVVDPLLYLLGRYSVERAKASFTEIFQVSVGAVESVHACLAVDIDDKDTYEYVDDLLSAQCVQVPSDEPQPSEQPGTTDPDEAGEPSPPELIND